MTDNNWFQTFKRLGSSESDPNPIDFYTFHHAGGSCQYFQPWVAKLPPWINLISIQLPGRWNRVKEAAFLRMDDLTPVLGAEFRQQLALNPGRKFAFYGHSLGGLVAYELTRYLMKSKMQLPVHLFISSKRSLQDSFPSIPIYYLTMDKFEVILSQMYGALPPEVVADPDIKSMFLDITKKDMELLDTYAYTEEPLISVPLTILRGTRDHIITLELIQNWKHLTSASCEIIEYPGDHFFLKESEALLLQKIVDTLSPYYTNNNSAESSL